jgi:hypothetical protein
MRWMIPMLNATVSTTQRFIISDWYVRRPYVCDTRWLAGCCTSQSQAASKWRTRTNPEPDAVQGYSHLAPTMLMLSNRRSASRVNNLQQCGCSDYRLRFVRVSCKQTIGTYHEELMISLIKESYASKLLFARKVVGYWIVDAGKGPWAKYRKAAAIFGNLYLNNSKKIICFIPSCRKSLYFDNATVAVKIFIVMPDTPEMTGASRNRTCLSRTNTTHY